MTTFLPHDANDNPIPVMRVKDGAAHTINATGSSSKNATAFDDGTRVISFYATEPVYIKFGGASVTATSSDHYFPAGVYYDIAIGGESSAHTPYVAVLAVSASGTVYISEKV